MRVKYVGKNGDEHTGLVLEFLPRDTGSWPYAGAQAVLLREDNRIVAVPILLRDPLEVLPEATVPQYDPTTGGIPS